MLNPETGRDDAKYFSMTVVMTIYMAPGRDRNRCWTRALAHLERAVREEVRLRGRSRDLDVRAATRARVWVDQA
jgi:hypothetical protein